MEFPHDNYYKLKYTDLDTDLDTYKNINFNVLANVEKIKEDAQIQAILEQLNPIIEQQKINFNSELSRCFNTQTGSGKSFKNKQTLQPTRRSERIKQLIPDKELGKPSRKPSRKIQALIEESLRIQSIYTPETKTLVFWSIQSIYTPETKTLVLVDNYKKLCILHNNELIELLNTPSPEQYQTHPLAYYLRYNLAAREILAQLLNMQYNGSINDSYRYVIYKTIISGLKTSDMLIHGGAYAISNITSELIPDQSVIQHEGTIFTMSDAILDITIIYKKEDDKLETKSTSKRTFNLSTRIKKRLYNLLCMMLGSENSKKILQSGDRNTPIDWNTTDIYIYHDKKTIKVKWFQFEFIKISLIERTPEQIEIFKSLTKPMFVKDTDQIRSNKINSYRFTLEGILTFNSRADSIQFNNNYERAVITRYLEYLYNLKYTLSLQLPNSSIPSLNEVYNSIASIINTHRTNLWSNWENIYEFIDNKINSTIDTVRDELYGQLQPHIFKFIHQLNDALESLTLARAVLGGGAVVVLHDSQNSKPIDDYDIYIFVNKTHPDNTQYSDVELEQRVDQIRIIIAKCIYSFYLYLKSNTTGIHYQIRYADANVFKGVNLFSMDCSITKNGRQREFSFLDVVIPGTATYSSNEITSYSKLWQINDTTAIYISSLERIMNTLQTMVIANRFDKLFKDAYRIQVIKNLFLNITGSETTIPSTDQYNIIHPNDLRDKTSVYYITTPAINYNPSTFDTNNIFSPIKNIDKYAYNCLLTSIYVPKPEFVKRSFGFANGRYKIDYTHDDKIIDSIIKNPDIASYYLSDIIINRRYAFLSIIYPANSLKGGNKYKKTIKSVVVSKSKSKSKSANKCNVNNKDQSACIIS